MPEVKVKTIIYKPNGDKPGEDNSGFDPFYGGEGENLIPFPRDRITPWWEDETEVSAPNGPPFMWEEFLQEKQNGFKGSYQDYLDVIDRSPGDYAKRKEGIMGVASAKDDRDYLKMLLSKYYTPNELFGKTIRELNRMLELHVTSHGGLI